VEKWSTFAEITGEAAAALIGLLFVAVSIRVNVIAASKELRNRAAQALSLFVTVLLVAIVLAIPDQAYGVLGGELIALAVILTAVLFALEHRARSDAGGAGSQPVAKTLEAISPNSITSVLLLASGVAVALGVHAGLYILVAPSIAALAGGVVSAWLLLTKVTD
jgi:hypothetical protein